MFLVKDCHEGRKSKIRSFLEQGEPAIAVILAAANFEWTIRRTIIALGKSKTSDYKGEKGIFYGCHGLQAYKDVWKKEVSERVGKKLPEVISDWQFFKEDAYTLRHKLIHGSQGTTGFDYAAVRVESLLKAADALVEVAESQNVSVYERIKVRRK